MGATFSRIKTWVAEILTFADLNAEFNNILTNLTPNGVDDASANATAMRVTADPYPASTESLPTSLEGELQRIRYVIGQITGKTYWYQDPDATAVDASFWGIKNLRLVKAKVGDATRVQVNPDAMNIALNIGPHYHVMSAAVDVDAVDNLDTGTLAAGTDYFVYACTDGTTLSFLISANSTNPTGFDAAHSRKIGGFHTLCVAVGTIGGHALTGYLVKDILPASVWCLKHRAKTLVNTGLVYDSWIQKWVDIYLQSGTGTGTTSANGGTITDTRNWMDFVDDGYAVGKRLLRDAEFQRIAAGSNEETNIVGSVDPGTTGGHSDTAGRRMISNIGCEDCCGVLWQWLQDQSSMQSADAAGFYDLPGSKGSLYRPANTNDVKLVAGGGWNAAAVCGSRSRSAGGSRWYTDAWIGARFVSEPL